MSKSAASTRGRLNRPVGYFQRSQQPLHSLIFLLPLIIIYELGTLMLQHAAQNSGQPVLTIRAYSLLNRFFEIFGVTGYYLPGIIVIVVLFCWHLFSKPKREDWQIRPKLYPLMGLECFALAIPLLVWGLVFFRDTAVASPPLPPDASLMATLGTSLATGAPGSLAGLMSGVVPDGRLSQQIILSIGAGIYEELLFRLIAIALLHIILVDLLALPEKWGAGGAVAFSAIAFGLYHFTSLNLHEWTSYDWGRCFFITCAGVFLAIVYVMRGFGIVAGTHAVYDVLMALLQYAVGT